MASGYSDLSEIQKNSQYYGCQQKPPKINLLNERPRRESVVEQQLESPIQRPTFNQQQVGELGEQAHSAPGSQQRASDANNNMISNRSTAANAPANLAPQNIGSPSSLARTQAASANQRSVRGLTGQQTNDSLTAYTELLSDLTQKESKLRREIAYINQHLANPWARPPQTRAPRCEPEPRVSRSQNRWVKECPVEESPSPRPTSRASSTTEADLNEKTERLLKDVEELERKPMKTQQILIESNATRRSPVADQPGTSFSDGGIHTAVIRVPASEPDNKSPLPFSYDNFSTKGVRGNIASVGATEPDTPYPPIFPVVKRTPSPRR